MDNLLPQLLAFPPHPPPSQPLSDAEYDKQIKSLIQLLNQTSASKLAGGVSGGGDLLDILDPSINTLPYLHTLLAHINASQGGKLSFTASSKGFTPTSQLWLRMLEFVDRFDPVQIRYAGHEWRKLVEAVARAANSSSEPTIAIGPIRTAMLRLDPTSSCFTSTHLLFVRLCLQARAFPEALPILDNDVFHFPASFDRNVSISYQPLLCAQHDTSSTYITTSSGISDKLNYKDHLQYFLYGAMLYIGVKNWERALLFLEIVIMSPTSGYASMIQVEAYKKWVLVGLLLKGRPLPMPRTTNSQAAKHYRAIGKAYDTIGDVFKDGNVKKLYDEAEAGQPVWQEDCNLGLMNQVLDAYRRFAVLKLAKTYAALSVSQIARRTSPHPIDDSETERYLTSLIAAGYLNATLSQSSGSTKSPILRFATSSTTGPHARSESQQHDDLVRQTAKTMKLANHIKQTDRRLELSKDYLEWIRKSRKAKEAEENGDGGASAMMQAVQDDYGADEDMMADM